MRKADIYIPAPRPRWRGFIWVSAIFVAEMIAVGGFWVLAVSISDVIGGGR